MRLSFNDNESFKEVVGSLRFDNSPSDPNSVTLELQELEVGSSSMPPQERNEDICFNNPPSDPNSLGRGSEDINIIAA
jgi:hypothetical protein